MNFITNLKMRCSGGKLLVHTFWPTHRPFPLLTLTVNMTSLLLINDTLPQKANTRSILFLQ